MIRTASVESGRVRFSGCHPRRLPLLALLAAALLAPGGAAAADTDAFRGLGTWIDIYDPRAWTDPEGTVAAIAARGVRTLYLETSNYRVRAGLVRKPGLGRLVEAAHEQGLQVVGWYLPSFQKPARDLRRSLAAIGFETPGGEAFDAFALDIESDLVRSAAKRNARLLSVSRKLRKAVGPAYPLGAIIPSPRGMELSPRYWPGFPYAELHRVYDGFLPMVYYTYRVEGGKAVRRYVAESIAVIRRETGDPDVRIHVIGGLGTGTSKAEARGFVRAVGDCSPLGYSLYDFHVTKSSSWKALAAASSSGGEMRGACRNAR